MNRRLLSVFSVALASAALATTAIPAVAQADPFKQREIHFETNASGCDMGIQMSFDTEGITEGTVTSPDEQIVFSLTAVYGMEGTSDITEVFQERVEPPITDLENALGCDPSEDAIPLTDLLAAWPAGLYLFLGSGDGGDFKSRAMLTHNVPAGPVITAPEDGDVVPDDEHLRISWEPVTDPILPSLGPVQIVGYHVVVAEIVEEPLPGGKTKTQLDADLPSWKTNFEVPHQYLRPNRMYEFEVLATEKGGNETITEGGIFCTPPIAAVDCVAPE